MTKPVYDFLGYHLAKAIYHRDGSGILEYLKIRAEKTSHPDSFYHITTYVNLKFIESMESEFVFKSAFKINDKKWHNEVPEEQLINLLFGTVFPYVRTTIEILTSDSYGAVLIPILNLKLADITKGIELSIEKQNKKQEEKQ